ncbi:hypothetical protein HOR51_gp54 [Ralstonia phage phiAp1]|uniref:Uncharacterized protein n=1 Tax=Ralstonia phage phiAp1 TaxID=2783867 RepID=A0A1L7DSA3_9CAUD|nr:hypothetical protein HOR51_gp54 [Ralstonia phage phiAp1]APU03195.1 hypothetical protein phiAp1_54 [Ralstonia phage phiAp1]
MSIANQTTNEVYALSGALENAERALVRYRTNSRNPAAVSVVDASLTALKTLLDAAVADATPTADPAGQAPIDPKP